MGEGVKYTPSKTNYRSYLVLLSYDLIISLQNCTITLVEKCLIINNYFAQCNS